MTVQFTRMKALFVPVCSRVDSLRDRPHLPLGACLWARHLARSIGHFERLVDQRERLAELLVVAWDGIGAVIFGFGHLPGRGGQVHGH